ncbi:MAG: DUF6515 family protein [Pseudomonadota bacterium]
MLYLNINNRHLFFKLAFTLLSILLLFCFSQTAYAERKGESYRKYENHGRRDHNYNDSRYHHNRHYPARNQYVDRLPNKYRSFKHRGSRYFFSGGIWYRPYGPRFTIVAPPIGLITPFLPPYYTTIWVGNAPYYYANEVYYTHRGDGYVVVEPPEKEVSEAPPPADKMFVYPRLDQNKQQQADDRYQCHRWAVDQTNFDPTQPPINMAGAEMSRKRVDYQRAISACLDGRGYTVK